MLFIIQIRKTFHSVSGIWMTARSVASCMVFNTILIDTVRCLGPTNGLLLNENKI